MKTTLCKASALSAMVLFALSVAQAQTPINVNNYSFEADAAPMGGDARTVPTGWTAFNEAGSSDIGSENSGGAQYTVNNPLAAPALGNQYCYINMFNPDVTGGIYQDVGPLQPNATYTLTVAIGSRNDRINSPGIISLVNGTDDTGTVLATGGGLPGTQNTWQNYVVTYTTGPSVSGDLTIMLSVLGNGTSIQADFDNAQLTGPATYVPLPILVTNTLPASATLATGSNIVFRAAFSNSPPVAVQWQQVVNGSPNVTNDISSGVINVTNNGVVDSTLTLNNLQPANTGSYQLRAVNATNSAAVVYSSLAPLTVVPLITWYPPGAYNATFNDDTVLALAGSVGNEVYGLDFGGSGLLTIANGYTFNDNVASGNMTLSGTPNTFGGYLGGATTGDGNLDLILNNGLDGSSAITGMLNNLTVGQTYTVMVLLDDTTGDGATTFHVTDGIGVSPEQPYAFLNGVPAIGGYIMGTFTAQSTSQPLTVLQNNGSGQYNAQYNAILLEKGIAAPPANAPTLTANINPLLSEVASGGPVTLSVIAAGSVPLHYQWYNQSGSIFGQTNSSYSFNAVSGTNSYYVDVSNTDGNTNSSTAMVISSTNIVTVNNFSFEQNVAGGPGLVITTVPTSWTAFNEAGPADIGSQWAGQNGGNFDYTVNTPLAPTASGNQFCYINVFSSTPVGGIYQDVGALQTNTVYTLTVAIGSRNDRINSPGIISLVQGTNSAGAVVATGGGLPATQNTWQDYTLIFTNGTSTGDLTVELSVSGSGTIQADFDNVRLTKVPAAGPPPPPSLHNTSFEAGTGAVPAYWTAFNDNNYSAVVTANGSDYTDPLPVPADGTNYFQINEGPSDPTGGIYQEFAPLQPNTLYTLTVAIGLRGDFTPGQLGSPGIISLINGDNNTGTVLASASGIPSTPGTWQDYTVTYTTGPAASGDLTVELSVAGASTYQANFDNVQLSATAVQPKPKFGTVLVSGGKLILRATGGSANGAYALLTTTNLTPPIIWTTNATGTLDSSGSFSNAIPISATPAAKFFRLQVP